MSTRQPFFYIVMFLLVLGMQMPYLVFSQTTETKPKPKSNADVLSPPDVKKTPAPQDYSQEEFAPWMYYMYRFGAVAVGSIPFTLMFATIAHDINKTTEQSIATGEFQNIYLPLFLSGPEKPPYSDPEVQMLLWSTLALSLSVSVVDLIILLVRQQRGLTIESLFN